MDDFVRCAGLLAAPTTGAAVRAQADAWLAAFRSDVAAWGVALAVLRGGPAAVPPEVRLQAASLLAWKCKRQLDQLQPQERQAELAEALTELAAGGDNQRGHRDVALRGVCVALANVALRCSGWTAPLDTLGPRLGQERMLEFLTLLPQECEDAVAAAQSASAELAWGLKTRAHEWSPAVAAWLHAVHTAGSSGAAAGSSSRDAPPSPSQLTAAAALAGGHEDWQRLTLAVLRCFTAWVKWGCLQYVDHAHATYLTSLAGELLFAPDPARGLPFHFACLPVAVDAATEVVEHATEALQPLLLQLAVALPARAAQLQVAGSEEQAAELCHVFALFCSTHCTLCAAEGPQGQALRQGLLQLLALPPEPGSNSGGTTLPAMGALSDLLEHLLARRRGERGLEEEPEQCGGLPCRPMGSDARHTFASATLEVLLQELQPYPSAFQLAAVEPADACITVQRGTRSPEGVPDALRREAVPVVDYVADLQGADTMVARLVRHADAALAQHGAGSGAAQAALDSSLHVLSGMAGLLETWCSERAAGDPPLQWLAGFLRLYALVPEVDGRRHAGGATAAPLTILHADLLASFCQLGPLVMPLLQGLPTAHQRGVVQLVLGEAVRALSNCRRTDDVAAGSTEDVVERAATTLRVLCRQAGGGSAAAAGLPTSAELLAGLQQGMLLLQQPARCERYQDAQGQLVAGLVHALHGVPPGDAQLRAQAEQAIDALVFQPLAAALREAEALAGAGAAPPRPAQARAAVWRLHAALRQYQALLNSLESYAWFDEDGGSVSGNGNCMSNGSGAGAAAQHAQMARGVAAAVASLLACWPQLAEMCGWLGRLPVGPGGGGLAGMRRELYQELSHCVCSCISLDRDASQQVLPSLVDTVATCLFLPGATVLSRPLIQALETYGGAEEYQQSLLGTVAAILSEPPARQLAALRGGDADPEAAQALLSLLGCCLRQATRWRKVAPPAAGAMEAVLALGLPLAAANTACHHRDTSVQAVSTLAALLALVLAADSPLHGALLGFAAQHGSVLVRGLLLALLALSSGSTLPKVVSLMSDVALLAATVALSQQQQEQQQAVCAESVAVAAAALLGPWLTDAQAAVVRGGVLSQEAMAALLAHWDWRPVLQQAAAQLVQDRSGGAAGAASMAEARRAMQRSVRQLAAMIHGRGAPMLVA